MFRWLKRSAPLPPFSAANPGQGAWVRTGFSNSERTWSEEASACDALAAALAKLGIAFERGKDRLDLPNGLIARPQFVALFPQDDGWVRTQTTIEINHATLCPAGTFEFQHAVGATLAESMQSGFESWAEADLPVFFDALRDKLERCTAMTKEFPAPPSRPARRRQVLLGPPVHRVAREVAEAGGQHDFCPCCLFTNSIGAFMEHFEADEFCGLRLFASRDAQGTIDADCRVNGIDFPAGREALIRYAARWPDRGFEFRKQFVAIRTLPLT